MRIDSIQNYSYKPAFGVKFTKKDIEEILNDNSIYRIKKYDQDDCSVYPKIYTMIKHLEEAPGDIAHIHYVDYTSNTKGRIITNKGEIQKIIKNNQPLQAEIRYYNDSNNPYGHFLGCSEECSPVEALEMSTLAFDDNAGPKDSEYHEDYVHMTKRAFEEEWWKNRHKTKEDIRKLAIDA